jgi:nitrate/nitrite transport system ATP-binding protein
MSALENVLLGVNQVFPHTQKKTQISIAKYYLSKVGMEASFHKSASELSQGMQQRVGIARAFAIKPKILLLDEPFGMLDSLTRQELQDVLLEIWDKEKITAIQITHDVDEAIFLADRIIMMTSGPKAQIGDILEIDFARPRHRKEIINHPDYYFYRKHLIDFLES